MKLGSNGYLRTDHWADAVASLDHEEVELGNTFIRFFSEIMIR